MQEPNKRGPVPSVPPRQVTRMKSAFLLAVTVLLSSNFGVFSTPTPEVAKTPLISAESLTDKANNPAKSAPKRSPLANSTDSGNNQNGQDWACIASSNTSFAFGMATGISKTAALQSAQQSCSGGQASCTSRLCVNKGCVALSSGDTSISIQSAVGYGPNQNPIKAGESALRGCESVDTGCRAPGVICSSGAESYVVL